MKAIFEFDFDDESRDDRAEFEQMNRASKVEAAIWQYSQKLRSMYKHGTEDQITIDTYDARQMLIDIFEEYGLSGYELL